MDEKRISLISYEDHIKSLSATLFIMVHNLRMAHWYVKGPNFFALHELFGKYPTLIEMEDDMRKLFISLRYELPVDISTLEELSFISPYNNKVHQVGYSTLTEYVLDDFRELFTLTQVVHRMSDSEVDGISIQISCERLMGICSSFIYNLQQYTLN